MTGKRVLMWTHGLRKEKRGLNCWLRMRFYKLAHGLLIYGNRVAHMLVERGYPDERIYVVFNSLDWDKQVMIRERITDEMCRQCRAQMFTHPAWPILVMSGRLVANKRMDMLLEAVTRLAGEGFDANVLLIGDGPEKTSLQALAERLRIADRVTFYGACYDEEVMGPLIASSDLCVVPGPIGLTCIHSLGYGTPVLIHDNPENHGPEYEAVIPGQTGQLFRYGDLYDLARAIREWIVMSSDRETIRRDCYRMVDKYYNPYFQMKVINAAVQGIPAGRVPCGYTQFPPLAKGNPEIASDVITAGANPGNIDNPVSP
ncbi:MAG: glycosyltransferase [Phycisphaerales bacterium]|nr:glycosyltransferase [Phycisphaerales bacterium]